MKCTHFLTGYVILTQENLPPLQCCKDDVIRTSVAVMCGNSSGQKKDQVISLYLTKDNRGKIALNHFKSFSHHPNRLHLELLAFSTSYKCWGINYRSCWVQDETKPSLVSLFSHLLIFTTLWQAAGAISASASAWQTILVHWLLLGREVKERTMAKAPCVTLGTKENHL